MYPIKTDNANITSSDVMCEIGNIACGHLITSLSNFACADFRITVPDMEFVGYDALPDRLGDMEQLTVSVLLELQGDIEGLFVFLAEPEFASAILEKIGAGPMCAETFGEDAMRDSALAELGNIMCSAYVDALCEFTGLDAKISVPIIAYDMLGSILTLPLARFAAEDAGIIYVKNSFCEEEGKCGGTVLLMPDERSVAAVMRKLGVSA